MCRVFDCRAVYQKFMKYTRHQRRALRRTMDQAVLDAGKERLHTLTE